MRYTVCIPVFASTTVSVEASNPEEAFDKAMDRADCATCWSCGERLNTDGGLDEEGATVSDPDGVAYVLKDGKWVPESESKAPAAPTERDEELHEALLKVSLWHRVGDAPDADLARKWELISNASLLEIAQAVDRVRAGAKSEITTESGKRITRIRVTVADRLAAACYTAACHDASKRPIVVATNSKQNKALMMVNCRFEEEEEEE